MVQTTGLDITVNDNGQVILLAVKVNDATDTNGNHGNDHADQAHTEAAGDHGAEHGGAFPPFDTMQFPSQIFWLVLCFVGLYLVLSRVGLPRVAGIFEAREQKLSSDVNTAKKLQEESEAVKTAYETELATARQNAHQTASAARDTARADADSKRREAEARIAEMVQKSEERIATRKAEALSNLEEIASETAAEIHTVLLGKAPAATKLKSALGSVMTNS